MSFWRWVRCWIWIKWQVCQQDWRSRHDSRGQVLLHVWTSVPGQEGVSARMKGTAIVTCIRCMLHCTRVMNIIWTWRASGKREAFICSASHFVVGLVFCLALSRKMQTEGEKKFIVLNYAPSSSTSKWILLEQVKKLARWLTTFFHNTFVQWRRPRVETLDICWFPKAYFDPLLQRIGGKTGAETNLCGEILGCI